MLAEIRDENDLEPAYDNQDPLPVMFCGLCKHFDDRRNCCLIKRELEWVGEWQQWLLARRTANTQACEELVVEFEHF
jgi:hypothetical protein